MKRAAVVPIVLAGVMAASYLGWPGSVFWKDLYWEQLIERGVVNPSRDEYPWTVAVDWSPDGSRLVSAGYHRDVLVWDPETGGLVRKLSGHAAWVQEAVFSPDGEFIASADWNGTLNLWSARTGSLERRFQTSGDLFSIAFHPTSSLLAVASYDGHVSVYDLENSHKPIRILSNEDGTLFVGFSPDGGMLAAGGEDKRIALFDGGDFREIGELRGHGAGITSLSFTNDGTKLLSCGDDQTVRLWDMREHGVLRVWQTRARWVNFCTLVPGTERFLTAGSDGNIGLWDLRKRKTRRPVGSSFRLGAVRPDHAGRNALRLRRQGRHHRYRRNGHRSRPPADRRFRRAELSRWSFSR
ncbi:MAG: WD40 repeat domain-containing protein [Deltaproteobacteria bacterium]|nr:WD40 repeat domain-containing protein [Deltaproteobacteria bacterium]